MLSIWKLKQTKHLMGSNYNYTALYSASTYICDVWALVLILYNYKISKVKLSDVIPTTYFKVNILQ